MDLSINPYLTQPDKVVLENLMHDARNDIRRTHGNVTQGTTPETMERLADSKLETLEHDISAVKLLKSYNDPSSTDFVPTIFTTWDEGAIPNVLNQYLVKPYARLAMSIVRHPTDVVFLTHIIEYLTINLGSAIWLFWSFSYLHAIAHLAYTGWCIGSFTLMMHNHIHNQGVLKKRWRWLDMTFPYIVEPLMGHTWDSYYYHHVKHHHVESNGMPFQPMCDLQH